MRLIILGRNYASNGEKILDRDCTLTTIKDADFYEPEVTAPQPSNTATDDIVTNFCHLGPHFTRTLVTLRWEGR